MRKFRATFLIIALFATPFAFADHMMMSDNKDCGTIADACKAAGFTDGDTTTKRFWQDCMEPVLMDKAVEGVTYDKVTATSCRMSKISDMKAEIKKLEAVKE